MDSGSNLTGDSSIINYAICRFNDFFSTVGENLANEIGDSNVSFESYLNDIDVPNTCVLHPVSREEVISIILKLENAKSPGYDDITNEVLNIMVLIIIV